MSQPSITTLLATGGVQNDALWNAVYAELKTIAKSQVWSVGSGSPLTATALVNEAWLRLAKTESLKFPSRSHFYGYVAKVMRSVLVNMIRDSQAAMRGQGFEHVALDDASELSQAEAIAHNQQILEVHEALEDLFKADPRMAQVVEMRYFGGLTEPEVAEALGVTERTVGRDWAKARLMLARMLNKV